MCESPFPPQTKDLISTRLIKNKHRCPSLSTRKYKAFLKGEQQITLSDSEEEATNGI
jgi:hypothetical protein